MFNLIKTLAVMLFLMAAVKLNATPLIVATEGDYPPFSYFDEAGNLSGFDVDIAHALCEAMQRECEVIAVPWVDLLDRLEAGDFQMIVASMAETTERKKRALFTDYYYRSQTSFVGDSRRFIAVSPDALVGRILSAGRDSIQADFLMERYSSSTILLTDNLIESFDLLVAGEVDLVLTDSINSLDFLRSTEGAHFDFISEPLIDPILKSEAHIAVTLGDIELVKAINNAIIDIRLSGIYDQINRRYVPFSIY
ncbi:transporter substrate-binding domain-containing protein [Nitrincola schmidtii]|uniref:transporter substrate-binding domain-containing protein n=1 Tax=Nitrincola schmidtii TaxID=1730894 RepID=UPI001457737B|nr:transporter substrate-binding domain-containing protein [Nitrincola schmidtii]